MLRSLYAQPQISYYTVKMPYLSSQLGNTDLFSVILILTLILYYAVGHIARSEASVLVDLSRTQPL